MKIKITQLGWANYTGEFGGVHFVDAVSVDDVDPRRASRLASLIAIETLEGHNPSVAQLILDSKSMSAPTQVEILAQAELGAPPIVKVWTREELETIADAKGIGGIREISDPLGLKSNSIGKLIEMVTSTTRAADPADPAEGLMGSSVQPSSFMVDGRIMTLGSVVRDAFARTQMTATEWNALPVELREDHIARQVEILKAI